MSNMDIKLNAINYKIVSVSDVSVDFNAVTSRLKGLLVCPITHDLLVDPVICKGDLHTYERGFIIKWFQESSKSPATGKILAPDQKTLISNKVIKNLIENIEHINIDKITQLIVGLLDQKSNCDELFFEWMLKGIVNQLDIHKSVIKKILPPLAMTS